ncbi:MAG: WD40 repeat domain-containing protein [Caldilineaceae bacterium]
MGLVTGRPLSILHRHHHQVVDIGLSGNGTTLASGSSDGVVHLWDLQNPSTENALRSFHGYVAPFYAMALNPAQTPATGEPDGRVRLWTLHVATSEATPLCLLRGHEDLVDTLQSSTDGRLLATGSRDKTVRLERRRPHLHRPLARTGQPGRERGISSGQHPRRPGRRQHHHAPPGGRTGREPCGGCLRGAHPRRRLAFSGDGRYLASCSLDNTVRVWDVATGACIHVFQDDVHSFWSLDFSPDSRLLAGGGRTGIRLWDLASGELLLGRHSALAAATNIRPVAFSPDGTQLVSGGIDRCVRLWDLADARELLCLRGHTADVTATRFLGDGEQLLSSSYDGTLRFGMWARAMPAHPLAAPALRRHAHRWRHRPQPGARCGTARTGRGRLGENQHPATCVAEQGAVNMNALELRLAMNVATCAQRGLLRDPAGHGAHHRVAR